MTAALEFASAASPACPVVVTETIDMPFAGEGSGSGGLNWGQQHILGAIRNLGSSMNMCAIRELAPTATFQDFDDEHEFPIRMVLVRQAGRLTHLVTVLNHFATDGAGAFAMYEDFLHRDPVTGLACGPVPTHPLDLTTQQATPAGRRQSDASLRYWRMQLAALPPRRPTAAEPEPESRYRRATLRSVPLLLGATKIAHRLECDVSAVLLGLFATALAACSWWTSPTRPSTRWSSARGGQ